MSTDNTAQTDKMTEVKEKVNEFVQEAHTAADNAGNKTVESFKNAEETIKPYIEQAERNVQLEAEKVKHAFEKTAEMTEAAAENCRDSVETAIEKTKDASVTACEKCRDAVETAIDKTKEASAAAAAKSEEITERSAEGTKAALQRAENAI
jgi:hypothetical protein